MEGVRTHHWSAPHIIDEELSDCVTNTIRVGTVGIIMAVPADQRYASQRRGVSVAVPKHVGPSDPATQWNR